ncbi:MAG: hypothetical protein ACM3U2_10885 [Deltaproteobacteria bacterium]
MSHELKAISAAIIALVGVVGLAAVSLHAPSFALACVGAVSLILIVVGLLTWIYQITR